MILYYFWKFELWHISKVLHYQMQHLCGMLVTICVIYNRFSIIVVQKINFMLLRVIIIFSLINCLFLVSAAPPQCFDTVDCNPSVLWHCWLHPLSALTLLIAPPQCFDTVDCNPSVLWHCWLHPLSALTLLIIIKQENNEWRIIKD